jgi:iron complex outermembrane receptor protein
LSPGESFTADFTLAIPPVEQTVTIEADTAKASLDQVPGSTALVEPATIQHSLTLTLKDVLSFTPGILVQPRFGADESQFSIRGSGLRSNFHERGVNLFINGSPYQDADGFSDFEALELASVRQIEVWKGPNALRYGGNTSGGAVNFITYMGENVSPFHVMVEGGSFGFFKGVISTGGVHGPISYYAAVSDTEIEGYREHSRQGRQRLYGNLGWRLSDATKVRFDLTYVNAAEQLPGALTRQEFLTNPRQADPNNVLNNWGRYQNAVRLAADLTHRLGDRQELEFIAYGLYRELWHPIFQVLDQDTRTFGGEIRYRYFGSLAGHGDRFVAGFAPQIGTQGDRNWQNVLGRPGSLAVLYGARAHNWGLYFENQFDIRCGLTFVVGGRGDMAYRRYEDHFLPNGGRSDERTLSAFSPKVGLTWQAAENVQVFGNVSRSYEPPLLFELTGFGAPGFLPLKPQDTWQYEVGTRGSAASRVNWDIAFFDLEVTNELLNVNRTPFPGARFTIPSYRNAPQTRHLGLETGLTAPIKDGVFGQKDRLSFRTAYTHAHYTFRGDATYGNNFLPGQPPHLLRAELPYQHPSGFWISPLLDWSPAEYFADSANTARNDAYVAWGLKAGYDWHNIGLFLEASNLTNRRYSASVQVDSGNQRYYEPANGRSFYGGARWHF